ncbi:hypothetical protein Aglo01_18510 [Actinokineospora globicatena]|nr:hypothetical protein Aglo01_18510 [Actinokineospora globicatena]GLW84203.1 hypothetical protein Aglo02_18430 [Actinokineospora globicatena]
MFGHGFRVADTDVPPSGAPDAFEQPEFVAEHSECGGLLWHQVFSLAGGEAEGVAESGDLVTAVTGQHVAGGEDVECSRERVSAGGSFSQQGGATGHERVDSMEVQR